MLPDTDNEAEKEKAIKENDQLVEEIFQHEDKDRNGFISHDEFSGPKHDELWYHAQTPHLLYSLLGFNFNEITLFYANHSSW